MPTEENKALIHRLINEANRQDAETQAGFYCADATNHGRPAGREGVRRVLRSLYTTFPDWHFALEEMVAEGEVVMCVMTMTGTHAATPDFPILGGLLMGVPPTGKRVMVLHSHLYRIIRGEIAEHRATRDDLGMMQQLGLLPAPQPTGGNARMANER